MTLKPGTRCECFEGSHEHESYPYGEDKPPSLQCPNDAVRLVTVKYTRGHVTGHAPEVDNFPMCEPCAASMKARWRDEHPKRMER